MIGKRRGKAIDCPKCNQYIESRTRKYCPSCGYNLNTKQPDPVIYPKRCPACNPCPMGVTGCPDDFKPHGHGGTQNCKLCGVPYYKVHPHSDVCPAGTPVEDKYTHDEYHMRHQLQWKRV